MTTATRYSKARITDVSPPYEVRNPRLCVTNARRTGATASEVALAGTNTYGMLALAFSGNVYPLISSPIVFAAGSAASFAWTDGNDIVIPPNTVFDILWSHAGDVDRVRALRQVTIVPESQFGRDRFVIGGSDFTADVVANAFPEAQSVPGTEVHMAPVLMVADRSSALTEPVVLGVGDSIWRYHHTYSAYGSRGADGHYGLGVGLHSQTGGRMQYATLSVSSTRPTDLGPTGFALRKAMLAAVNYPFDVILSNTGRNTLADGTTATNTALDNAWAFLKTLTNDNPKRLIQTTISATVADSNVKWSSTSQSTINNETSRRSVNNRIRTLPTNVDGCLDLARAYEIDTATYEGRYWYPPEQVTVLAADAMAGTQILVADEIFLPGDHIAIGTGLSSAEIAIVTTIAGSGPYTLTLQTAGGGSAGIGGVKSTHTSGEYVRGIGTPDGVHSSTQMVLRRITPMVEGAKAAGLFTGAVTNYATVG